MIKKYHLFFFIAIFVPASLLASIHLPSFFGNNMVLQQQTNAAIWGWATPSKTVTVTTSWNHKKYSVKADGNGYWKLAVATPVAGGPYNVVISDGTPLELSNVLIGEVWLCSGQSNMEMPMKGFRDQPILGSNEAIFNSDNDQLRLYTVPRSIKLSPQDSSKNSDWKISGPEAVSNFSATAYYFGKMLQQKLHVPVGLVNISYGGTPAEAWMSAEALKSFPEIKVPTAADSATVNWRSPNVLYNGMLHPFAGFTIKGCIWYQGETNNGRPDEYEQLFPAMVAQWRQEFGQGNFPFYFAQIAPFKYSSLPATGATEKENSAYLRDAQRKSLDKIPNSGMVVLMDIGEENSIHPKHKETGGNRFAYLALAQTYGLKGFGYASPVFDTMSVKGNVVTVKLTNTHNGLTTYGQPLVNFEIAGADKVFYPAQAVIYRAAVLVSSPQVPNPVAVRYAFKDFVMGELFNTEGFPVSSFRTDNW